MHGKGLLLYTSGSSYEGDFINHKKDGKGIFKWKTGTIYEGEWKNNK